MVRLLFGISSNRPQVLEEFHEEGFAESEDEGPHDQVAEGAVDIVANSLANDRVTLSRGLSVVSESSAERGFNRPSSSNFGKIPILTVDRAWTPRNEGIALPSTPPGDKRDGIAPPSTPPGEKRMTGVLDHGRRPSEPDQVPVHVVGYSASKQQAASGGPLRDLARLSNSPAASATPTPRPLSREKPGGVVVKCDTSHQEKPDTAESSKPGGVVGKCDTSHQEKPDTAESSGRARFADDCDLAEILAISPKGKPATAWEFDHQTSEPDTWTEGEYIERSVEFSGKSFIPYLFFLLVWSIAAAGTLYGFVYIYVELEVVRVEDHARELAVAHTRLQASRVFGPAVGAVATVQAAYRSGALKSLSDYNEIMRLVKPHFISTPWLKEIELVSNLGQFGLDGVSLGNGSVLVSRGINGIELVTDRYDCRDGPGRTSCTSESMLSSNSHWFREASGVGQEWWYVAPPSFWHGLTFLADKPDEVDCEDACWSPIFSFVQRLEAGRPTAAYTPVLEIGEEEQVERVYEEWQTTTTMTTTTTTTTRSPRLPTVFMRTAIALAELQAVSDTTGRISRGEVFVCKITGELVASIDMADVIFIDPVSGSLRPGFLWELDREWLQTEETERWQTMIRKGRKGQVWTSNRYRISADVLDGATPSTESLGDALRLVIVIRTDAFSDDVLGSLILASEITCVAPLAVMVLLLILAAYLKFCTMTRSGRAVKQISPFSRLS